MTGESFKPSGGGPQWPQAESGAPGARPEPGRVLVAGRSEITRVVVSRIVERAGLRPVSAEPEAALALLADMRPCAVVMDGGPDNRDCDGLMATVEALRRVSEGAAPRVVLLSNRIGDPRSLALHAAVDEVVAKPITPERLQPVLARLAGRGARG